MQLKNKKALITGASKGIGLAIAEALANEGGKLFITARDEKALKKISVELVDRGCDIDYAVADLNDAAAIEAMFKRAFEYLGGLDILVNNAGVGIRKTAASMKLAEWDEMFNVNLRAAFLLSKLASQKMIAQHSGYIINIGSGASQTPIAEYAAYCATKYGLLGFSESLALELREHNIKVSTVLPGSTASYFGGSAPESKMASKPGILLPQDVADAVLFLLKQSSHAWTSMMNLRPQNLNKRWNINSR
jgi:3-oxoacyl-[acyl-carrier protein] reductase